MPDKKKADPKPEPDVIGGPALDEALASAEAFAGDLSSPEAIAKLVGATDEDADGAEAPATAPAAESAKEEKADSEPDPDAQSAPETDDEAKDDSSDTEPTTEEASPSEDVAAEDAPAADAAAAADSEVDGEESSAPAPRRRTRQRRTTMSQEEREAKESEASTWKALDAARKQNTVLEGEVVSVSRRYRKDPRTGADVPEAMMNAFITNLYQEPLTASTRGRPGQAKIASEINNSLYAQRIMVSIPFASQFYRVLPVNTNDLDLSTAIGRRTYILRQEQMARKLIKTKVPFCITHMERDEGEDGDEPIIAIGGSRKKALPFISSRVFAPRRGRPLLKAGDVVNTKALSVGRHNIQVTCAGVDTIVPIYMLTFRYISDLRNSFDSGSIIPMQVMNIWQREDESYAMALSGRSIELEDSKKKMKKGLIHVHDIVRGTFVQITQNADGRCTAIAWLDGFDMPAFVNNFAPRTLNGDTPISGDQANLIVTRLRPDTGFVITNCQGILGSPAQFMG